MDKNKEYPEKEEKQFDEKDEKEVLKHDEKVEQQDQLSSVTWALILIWAGLAFLSVNLGWFDVFLERRWFMRLLPDDLAMFEPGVWSLIMLGAGVILLLATLLRLLMPKFHRNVGGTLILAAVFIGVGLGNIFGWSLVWPVLLIAMGLGVLIGGLARSRR